MFGIVGKVVGPAQNSPSMSPPLILALLLALAACQRRDVADSGVAGPFVIKEAETYKMWYRESSADGRSHISYATSGNGIDWKRYQGNPIIAPGDGDDGWDTQRVGPGKVLKRGGLYRVWYLGFNRDGVSAVGFAQSKDGLHWEKYKGNPVMKASPEGWDSKSVVGLHVLFDEGVYKMWYAAKNRQEQAIGYAHSKDGIHWVRHKDNPVLRHGSTNEWDNASYVGAPHVLKMGNIYHMWYAGRNLSDEETVRETGYASSSDGIRWQRHGQNPVLKRGKRGSWDSQEAARNSVIYDQGIFKMWYKAKDAAGIEAIGYATSKDGVTWGKHANNPCLSP